VQAFPDVPAEQEGMQHLGCESAILRLTAYVVEDLLKRCNALGHRLIIRRDA